MSNKLLRFRKKYATEGGQKVQLIKRASSHPAVAIPAVTISILLFLSVIGILVVSGGKPQLKSTDTHVVIINHDKVEQTLPTREKNVGDILKRADVAVNAGDVVEPALDTEVVSDNFRINVYRAVPVTIVDRGVKTFAYSAAKTARSIVKQAGIEVFPEDQLDLLPAQNFLVEGSIGQRLVVKRATAINLNLYGTQLTLRTQASNVAELLKEKNIKLSQGDTVEPALDAPLKSNGQVFVLREGIKIEFVEERVRMPEQIIEDASLSFGTQVLRQQGTTGKRLVTYQVNEKTGERKKIQSVNIVEAVPQIIARGKAVQIPGDKRTVMAAAGIASSDYPYVDFIISHESGWCPTKWQGHPGHCPPYFEPLYDLNGGRGYGLGQATPPSKMAVYGSDWKTSAATQLKWAKSYVKGRYGGWAKAYNFWQANHYW
jgi:uncharacterized protein YabE (DUF348 family)